MFAKVLVVQLYVFAKDEKMSDQLTDIEIFLYENLHVDRH